MPPRAPGLAAAAAGAGRTEKGRGLKGGWSCENWQHQQILVKSEKGDIRFEALQREVQSVGFLERFSRICLVIMS